MNDEGGLIDAVGHKNGNGNTEMKNKSFMLIAFLFVFTIGITAFAATRSPVAAKKYLVYFGTGARGNQGGIFSSVLDVDTGQLTKAALAGKVMRAGIVTIHPKGTYLYSTGKPAGFRGGRRGSVCSFKIDQTSGTLRLLNSQPCQGRGPCYLFVDPKGGNLLVANYGGETAPSCRLPGMGRSNPFPPFNSIPVPARIPLGRPAPIHIQLSSTWRPVTPL